MVKIPFARAAVLAALASAVLLGGAPAYAAVAPSSATVTSYASNGDDGGLAGWWEEFLFGEKDSGSGLFG